eukprot:426809-Pleurochrysis_carterae.AAC.4
MRRRVRACVPPSQEKKDRERGYAANEAAAPVKCVQRSSSIHVRSEKAHAFTNENRGQPRLGMRTSSNCTRLVFLSASSSGGVGSTCSIGRACQALPCLLRSVWTRVADSTQEAHCWVGRDRALDKEARASRKTRARMRALRADGKQPHRGAGRMSRATRSCSGGKPKRSTCLVCSAYWCSLPRGRGRLNAASE